MIAALAIGLVAGVALGAAHLASLWWSVVLMRDGRPILGFVAQVLRFCRPRVGARVHRPSWRSAASRRGVRRAGVARPFAPALREDRVRSPLALEPLFHIGPALITEPVVVTWAIIALLGGCAALSTRRLTLTPSKTQATVEILVSAIDDQIRGTMQRDPAPFRALIGSIFLFVLISNWSSLVPGVEPPTAHIETDAAMALIVFVATIAWGVRTRGLLGYLATFAEPSWVMIPLNIVEQFTRTFSLIVRLFGNVMSGVFVIGIVLTLAGLIVPIPLMALDLLTGTVQAYIFAVLATVFIGAAVGERRKPSADARP